MLTVTLSDASLADAPSKVLAQKAVRTEGKQSPFSFVLPFNPADVQPNARILLSAAITVRSEEHTSELQSQGHISYAVFCLKKIVIGLCTVSYTHLRAHETKANLEAGDSLAGLRHDGLLASDLGQIGEHTSELQSQGHISYAVFCLKKLFSERTNCLTR